MLPNYEETRNRYFKHIQGLKQTYRCVDEETAYNGMHFCYCSNTELPKKLFVLTAGIHGIEGYVGSEMICYFIDDILCNVDLNRNAVIIVNFINAWGMRHLTRNNAEGIDLNRNFIEDFSRMTCSKTAHPFFKGDWVKQNAMDNSRHFFKEVMPLFLSRYWLLTTDRLLRGQYIDPTYPFYGGTELAPENIILTNWLKPYLKANVDWLLADLHTGIGDYGTMTMILDRLEPKSVLQWRIDLGFSNVLRTGEGAMYDIDGDFTGWLYQNQHNRSHFSITVEFGLRKKHFFSTFLSMKHLITENGIRLNHLPITCEPFIYDFFPKDERWWERAQRQFKKGMLALIDTFHYLDT
ncbi:DUF2817 domain-containing protein [Fusibacter paucivorans]|uniref:DUF2817 domain-containing protein n=1 Tax=Fusibacter paucivorans TaxID=76009 RepID=A0ABS5PNQ9_9FIRM|nr:DUF2817 domain-containing protein [Fusibacter paucivorans]MBS7526805.1 DUF2817 domain-containing protein [Fusibacter paucivorans]